MKKKTKKKTQLTDEHVSFLILQRKNGVIMADARRALQKKGVYVSENAVRKIYQDQEDKENEFKNRHWGNLLYHGKIKSSNPCS